MAECHMLQTFGGPPVHDHIQTIDSVEMVVRIPCDTHATIQGHTHATIQGQVSTWVWFMINCLGPQI